MAELEVRKKSISEKAQKLRETTFLISNTLNSLETPRMTLTSSRPNSGLLENAREKVKLAGGSTGTELVSEKPITEKNELLDTLKVGTNHVNIIESNNESRNFIGLTSLNNKVLDINNDTTPNNSSTERQGYKDQLNLYDKINQLQYALSESQLEIKYKNLEYETLAKKYEQLKCEKHDSHIKSSRKGLDINSLIQQNEIYRDENRKLIESEAKLRAKVLELSIPKCNTPYSLDSQDQAIYGQVLQKLDSQITLINQKSRTLKSSIQLKKTTNPLEVIREMLELLLITTKKLSQPVKPKIILNLINDLSENLELLLSQAQSLLKNTHELDNRIENLGLRSNTLTSEATDTIEKLKKIIKSNKVEWERKEKTLIAQSNEIKDRYKNLLKENEELIMVQKEIIAENEELAQLAGRPDPDPEVVLLNGHSNQVIERYQEIHKEDVKKLQSHIEYLTKTIDEWKDENKILNSELKDSKLAFEKLEKEMMKSTKLLSETQNRYEDEKLKNQKAVELIKSLKEDDQKQVAYSNEIQNLEQLIKDTINVKENKENNIGLNNMIYADNQSAEMNVLKHLKVIDEKTKQIKILEQKLNDAIVEFKSVAEDKDKIKQKSLQQKDKFHVRELAWLDKLKEMKEANVLNTKELEELNNCLESYAEQFSNIHLLLNQNEKGSCHPLPFSTLFHTLYHQFKNIAEDYQKLEKEISDTTHMLTIRTKESHEHLKQCEKLELSLKEKIEALQILATDKTRMEIEQKELEKQLTEAQQARKEANETLKVVISRTAQYITTEN